MYLSLILLIVPGLILWRFMKRLKIASVINKLPGPPTVPGFGNYLELAGTAEHLWKGLRRINKEYGPNCRIWTPYYIAANINNPDDVETILTDLKMITKNQVYNFVIPWLKEGLLTSTGRKWQTRRKMLTPAFHFNILKKYFEVISEQCDRMVEELQSENGTAERTLDVWVSDHTLNIICETAMGISFSKLGKEVADEYKNAVHTMGKIATHRIVRPWLVPNLLFNLSYWAWKQYRTVKILHGFSTKIINERKSYHEKTGGKYLNNLESEDETIGSTKKRLAMLDLLIAAYREGKIDDLGMREEVDTFVFEGYDTTALALSYSILCLAEFSEHQDLARKEIELALKESDGKFTTATVQKFTYLERCIKETIRLYPSVPFLGREVPEDLQLKNHVIPAGCIVNIFPYDVHRNPKHWPDPETFDPDRFLPENIKGRHPFAYIPFSGGFRNCIGQKFAMLELKTFIGHILHNFTIVPIETTKDIQPKCDIVLRSVKSLRVKFVPLEK